MEKAHIRLLSSAKEIDQEIKDGRRGFVFSASAVQVSASLLAKKLRVVAEMAGEDLSVEKQKDKRRLKKKPRPINERLTFGQGQVLFDGRDLNVGTGAALDITKALIEDFGQVVPFKKLDGNSLEKQASEKIRTAIGRIQSFISYGLGLVSFLLSVLTNIVSCYTLSYDIKYKQIYTVVTKPIRRFELIIGKVLGVVLLDLLLLA
ncbi:MAG: hypothetical protein MUO33_07365, partial [Sedimentisphaerales bacterium]|nr:hypothetical protein [Sedimentisphaerales bacterium]